MHGAFPVAKKVAAGGDQHSIATRVTTGAGGWTSQLAELFFDAASGLSNAHFIKTVEQQDYSPGFKQVQHNLGIEYGAQFSFEMFANQAFKRNSIGKLAQVDFDRNRAFGIVFAVAGQFVGKPLDQCAFTGTVIAKHQPQPTSRSRNPLEGMRQHQYRFFVVLLFKDQILVNIVACKSACFVALTNAGKVG